MHATETYNTASKARKQKAEEAEEKVKRKKLTFQTRRFLWFKSQLTASRTALDNLYESSSELHGL